MSEPGTSPGADVPEAARRRLGAGSWSSGLTVADFAACRAMGLRPLALVQGFCAMQWGWYASAGPGRWGGTATGGPGRGPGGASPYSASGPGGPSGGYSESWPCPHGIASMEHRWGYNFEQPWVQGAWSTGFGSAYRRMMEEAEQAGACGVVDVVDSANHLAEQNIVEFHLMGTAVALDDASLGAESPGAAATVPPQPWSTYLAGQRLAKLFEAGLAPVSVAAALASVQTWPNCQTEYLLQGSGSMWGSTGGEIEQLVNAETAARRLARAAVRAQLGSDALHGALFSVTRHGVSGGHVIECTLRGTRVRRFKDFDPLPAPRPTVRLS